MSARPRSRPLHPVAALLALLTMASCGEHPTETPEPPAPLHGLEGWTASSSARGPHAGSNGQLFVPIAFAGFGVVQFPDACFVFDPVGDVEPDSWIRATLEEITTMEHMVVQEGLLLVGSFFTGLEPGGGHGVLNVHFGRDGTFRGSTISVVGRLDDGRSVNCKLNVGPSGEVVRSSIKVGSS